MALSLAYNYFPVFRLGCFIVSIYYYGFVVGILAPYLFKQVYNFMMKLFFGFDMGTTVWTGSGAAAPPMVVTF